MPPLPPSGLVVIIQKDGGIPEKKEPLDVGARTKIEPQGIGGTNPLRVRITRESDDANASCMESSLVSLSSALAFDKCTDVFPLH